MSGETLLMGVSEPASGDETLLVGVSEPASGEPWLLPFALELEAWSELELVQ